ncbi:MAG: energy transducer TonB [Methylobacter sp.]|jgi:protein TonB|nr:energy transducer TonB [Methylobacter sp.]
MRQFFQQVKYGFIDQQGLHRQTAVHEQGRYDVNNPNNQRNNITSIEDIWPDNTWPSLGGSLTEAASRRPNWFFAGLFTKQRTVNMAASISILVLLLHGLGLIWLRLPGKPIAPAHPIVEVTIIPVSAVKPKVAPPPPPAAEIKPSPRKTQPKPMLKKRPVMHEPADFAPTKQVLEAQPVVQTAPTAATTASMAPTTKIEPFIEADINADYAENPKPDYPAIAQSRGWEGKVLLKVQVSNEGLSDAIEIERSSGYEILDESAIEAVKKWRFTPAKRGETPIASSAIVPIIFILQDQDQS